MAAAAADNAARLTKKQRKAQAFRDKKGKGKGPKGRERPEPLDVPEQDDPDAENEENDEDEHASAQPQQPTQKKKTGAGQASTDGPSKKRKHSDDAADAPAPKVKKRRKSIADEGQKDENENELVEEETDASKPKKDSERQKRYILFVGNLKYTTTKEAILKHFSICDPPPTVRLLAPKSTKTATGAARSKSKGCAFLEFATRPALQSALALHGSTLDSRQINVELTAGGGGKGTGRLEKLRARNRGLAEQRTKSLMKQAAGRDGKARAKAGATDPDGGVAPPPVPQPDRPQRHSTTSGVDVIPLKPRTWSVPEDGDDASSNPRKKRGSKSKGESKPRNHGTGVNAIPVG